MYRYGFLTQYQYLTISTIYGCVLGECYLLYQLIATTSLQLSQAWTTNSKNWINCSRFLRHTLTGLQRLEYLVSHSRLSLLTLITLDKRKVAEQFVKLQSIRKEWGL